MEEILFVCLSIALFFIIGTPFVFLLQKKYSNYEINSIQFAPIWGLAVSAVSVTVLYRFNLSMSLIWWVHLITGLTLTSFLFFKKKIAITPNFKEILFPLITLILLTAPIITGGRRFTVFQGNQFDNAGYTQGAISYSKLKFNEILNLTEEDFTKSPTLIKGKEDIFKRPTIHLLFSFTGQFFPKTFYRFNYSFLISLYIIFFLAIRGLITSLTSSKNSYLIGATATAIVVGFWGQYVLDINAWSQMAAQPIMIFLIYTLLESIKENRIFHLPIFLLTAALTYIYPELLLFFLAPIMMLFAFNYYRKRITLKSLSIIFATSFAGLLIGLLYYQGTIGFVIRQLIYTNQEANSWWTYFQRYLFGQGDLAAALKESAESILANIKGVDKQSAVVSVDWILFMKNFFLNPENVANIYTLIVNIFSGLWGLYFITPIMGLSLPLLILWTSALLLFISLVTYISFGNREIIKSNIIILIAIIALEILALLSKKQFWGAGKGLSYVAPLILVFVASKFCDSINQFQKSVLALFFCTQLAFGTYRIFAATNTGAHYASPPYVALMKDAVDAKVNYSWNFEPIFNQVSACKVVSVTINDRWIREYVLGALYLREIPFVLNRVSDCDIDDKRLQI